MEGMKQQIELLHELQQVDSRCETLRQSLRDMDDGSNAAPKLELARKKLASAQKKQHELEATIKDKELRLQGAEQEQAEKSKQAYGGTISDPKQLSALEKKIGELGRLKDSLEEETLELMDEAEHVQQVAQKRQTTVDELAQAIQDAKAQHASGTRKAEEEMATLAQTRQELTEKVDGGLLKQYENLAQRLGGLAVAAVRQGACTGCKVGLPSTYAPKLLQGDALVKCENCRRILYLPDGESPFKPEEDI